MKAFTAKNFSVNMAAIVRSAKTQRDNIQSAIAFSLHHYGEHADTMYLSKVLLSCVGVKSLATKTMQNFIQAHANVVWSKGKDGSPCFKKCKDEQVKVEVITSLWYDFDDNGQDAPEYDVIGRIHGMIKAITKADEGEGKTVLKADCKGIVGTATLKLEALAKELEALQLVDIVAEPERDDVDNGAAAIAAKA